MVEKCGSPTLPGLLVLESTERVPLAAHEGAPPQAALKSQNTGRLIP